MTTRPEIRIDKNGVPVTRHVKDGVADTPTVRIKSVGLPSANPRTSVHSKDPSFKIARNSFAELNPGDDALFDDFYLGSGIELELDDVLKKNPDLSEEDVHVAILSNGLTSYWLRDEHLTLPEDQELMV